MKTSITITIVVIIGIFGFVSGYSIGFKIGNPGIGTQASLSRSAETVESSAPASGGYGAPATGGYGAPAAGGYGQ